MYLKLATHVYRMSNVRVTALTAEGCGQGCGQGCGSRVGLRFATSTPRPHRGSSICLRLYYYNSNMLNENFLLFFIFQ
jgi:hypothetical protein